MGSARCGRTTVRCGRTTARDKYGFLLDWQLPETVELHLDNRCDRCAIVDYDLYPVLVQWKWHANPDGRSNTCYAVRKVRLASGKVQTIYLHRWIMEMSCLPLGPRLVVDHINRNTLDNRRVNLRWATLSENGRNRHGFVLDKVQMEMEL